eukprot:gene10327-10484_t
MDLDEGSHNAVCLVKDLNTGLVRDAFKVWRRTPGEPDTLIYTEHDRKHFVALTRTKDWSYLLINSHSKLSSEVDRAITDMDVFDRCVVLHHTGSQPLLSILELEVQPSHSQQHHQRQGNGQLRLKNQREVSLPDWVFAIRPGINQDHLNTSFRLYASSPAMPERLWATAGDGVQVPITLVHQQGLPFDGCAPLLLEVYGAYGQILEADYKTHRLPLLRRGWSVALAHVRGGGELGRRWHAAGRQKTKRNSVQDLLSCLQLLFSMQVTSPGLVAGHAVSAGALTLAAAVNAEPSLFAAVVLECPFLELCSPVSHALDEHEQDEWGDPRSDAAAADVVAGLCPYNNMPHIDVASGRFPAVLATAGLQDTRVPFWMPLKYVARLRSLQAAAKQCNSNNTTPVLLQFDKDAGHFDMGVSGGVMQDVALQHAFFCNVLLRQRAALPSSAMVR